MGRPRKGAPRIVPTCHPELLHWGFGFCYKCYRKDYYKRNRTYALNKSKERYNLHHPEYKYGLTIEEHTNLLARAKCGICGNIPKTTKVRNLVIDHDHMTKKVRGVLCRSCNTKLGWLESREKEIKSYLEPSI